MNCGSVLSLKASVRCGLSRNAFQIRPTVDLLSPDRLAIDARDQCVASGGVSSTVGTDTPSSAATCLLVAPVAHASTIRHRNASAWELLARRDQRVSVWRSSSVKINGALGRPVLAIR